MYYIMLVVPVILYLNSFLSSKVGRAFAFLRLSHNLQPYCSSKALTDPMKNKYAPVPQKTLICISPGGFKGFYMMGIVAYIKENYDLTDCYFSGASAGSWNAILFSYKENLRELFYNIIGDKHKLTKNESIHHFEIFLKNRILQCSQSRDYELHRASIGVCTLKSISETDKHNLNIVELKRELTCNTLIFSNFNDLEDALNCCIASSHVPFITGGLINKYKNIFALDGGLSRFPYYSGIKTVFHITPNMWGNKVNHVFDIESYTTLLCKEKYNFHDLFESGYSDTHKNREKLDKIFPKKT